MTALKSFIYLLIVQNFGFYSPLALYRSGLRLHTEALAYAVPLLW